jgi:transcriptional regulator with XRE-family HTH domain
MNIFLDKGVYVVYGTNMNTTANQNIKNLRLILGLTRAEFCDRLGVTESMISRIENCKTQVSAGMLDRLMEIYHIRPARLLTDDFFAGIAGPTTTGN